MVNKLVLTSLLILVIITVSACMGATHSTGIDLEARVFVPTINTYEIGGSYASAFALDGSFLYFITHDNNQTRFRKISLGGNEMSDIPLNFLTANKAIDSFALNSKGDFVFLVSSLNENSADPLLVEVSATNELISEASLSDLLNLSAQDRIDNIYAGADDEFFLTGSRIENNNMASIAYAMNGAMQVICELATPDYLLDLVKAGDDVYLHCFGDANMTPKKWDLASGMTNDVPLPSGINRNSIIGFAYDEETGLICADITGLWELDLPGNAADKILNWSDSGVSAADLSFFGKLADGQYLAVKQTDTDGAYSLEVIVLAPATYGELPPRHYITYATGFLDTHILDAIVDFNKTNGKYYIVVDEYFGGIDFMDSESLAYARARFDLAITSANPPDLINIQDVDFGQMAAKGGFAELNTLIETSKIKQSDYHELSFGSFSVDEAIYAIVPAFRLRLLAGHRSKLPGIDSWTVAEMMEWAGKYPSAKLLRGDDADILSLLMASEYERFVDWQSGECDFVSDEFLAILEFASAFQVEDDMNDRSSPHYIGLHEGFASGDYLLRQADIFDINSFYVLNALFDGEPYYIGYPTSESRGILAAPVAPTAIAANSNNKEGAFAFISYLLGEDFQNGGKLMNTSIPVKHSAIDNYAERLLTETPGSGKRVPHGYSYEDMFVLVDLSQDKEYVELLKDMVYRADGILTTDNQILLIIDEEAASFFAGQKTAIEAAEIIQNRVQVYINENR